MPRGDGTGPGGMGPMTGRAAGYCAGYSVPGFANPISGRGGWGWGRGFGWGRGRGRGWGYGFGAAGWPQANWAPVAAPMTPPSKEEQAQALKEQAEYLEQSLSEIKQRLAGLEESGK